MAELNVFLFFRFTLKHGMEVKQMSDCAVKLYYYLIMLQKHKRERRGNLVWRVVLLLRLWVISRDMLHLAVSHPVPDGTPLTSARPWKSDLMEQHRATFWVIPFRRLFALLCVWRSLRLCVCVCARVCRPNMLFNNWLYVVSCPVRCRCH